MNQKSWICEKSTIQMLESGDMTNFEVDSNRKFISAEYNESSERLERVYFSDDSIKYLDNFIKIMTIRQDNLNFIKEIK